MRTRSRRGLVLGAAGVAILVMVAWWWSRSLMPHSYSMADMGYPDYGGGPSPVATPGSADHGHHVPLTGASRAGDGHDGSGSPTGIDISTLVADRSRPADVRYDLVARAQRLTRPGATPMDGFTLNGTSPGPTLTATVGQLVEVRLKNDNIADGTTLHWHGVDLTNAMDGVAGVTQDAVRPGETFVYRFIAQEGSYWYHSHQVSHPQVTGGLLGALIVTPADPDPVVLDLPMLVHTYGAARTINGEVRQDSRRVEPGQRVRVRVINTDPGPIPVWVSGAPFAVVAVDGRDLHEPGEVRGQAILVTAAGRADLELTVPAEGVRVEIAGASLSLTTGGSPAMQPAPRDFVDLLHYGTPAALPFDPDDAVRDYEYTIARRYGLLDGRPGSWWTINGGIYPDVPMYMVREGEVVRFRISNRSGEVHPMHLHGHHMLVVSRDGVASSGSPWWVDSLNIEDGQTFVVAMRADNPGLWMDHCHNLRHASEGLMTHLMYEGYTTPFRVGDAPGNHPE